MTNEFKCTCKSEFQDQLYGKGIRLFNSCGDSKGKLTAWRCTVCGREIKA
jgi:hypothetical protein